MDTRPSSLRLIEDVIEKNQDQIARERSEAEQRLGTDDLVLLCFPAPSNFGVSFAYTRSRDLKPDFLKQARRNTPSTWSQPFASCNPNYDAPHGSKALWVCIADAKGSLAHGLFTRVTLVSHNVVQRAVQRTLGLN